MSPTQPCLIGFLAGALASTASADSFRETVLPVLESNCYDCHDDQSAKGDLDLSRFDSEDAVMADRSIWDSVYEKIESGQMPPPKEERQPTAGQRRAILAWIEEIAARPDPALGARDPGKPVLRRLTRLEYNNTLRDLLGLDFDLFVFPERLPLSDRSYFQPAAGKLGDQLRVPLREYGGKYPVLLPQAGLPGDNRAEHGFRNRGEAMDFSPLLLEKYVQLAGDIVNSPELPIRSPKFASLLGIDPATLPTLTDRKPRPDGFREAPLVPLAREFAPDLESAKKPEAAPDWIGDFRSQVASAFSEGRGGVFDLPGELSNLTVAGKGGLLKARFGDRMVTINPNADLWLADFATATESSAPLLLTNKEKGQKVFELTFDIRGDDEDEGIERLGVCVLGRKGHHGPVTLTAKLTDDTETVVSAEIAEGPDGTTLFTFAAIPGESIRQLHIDASRFSGDYILLDDIGLVTNGRPQSKERLSRKETDSPDSIEAMPGEPAKSEPLPPPRARLAAFIEAAFRRPVGDAEVAPFFRLYEQARTTGADEPAAMRGAVQAVLAAPSFLFLEEGGPREGATRIRRLGDFELASRLACFLWSSCPDAELFAAARAGRLSTDPEELARQAARMLRDPRAKELSESFAVQWLRLDQIHTSKPDRDLFGSFYSGPQGKSTLHGATLVEPLLLFETVMVENRSILDFIAADYTWLNGPLVGLYQLGESANPQIAMISGDAGILPADSQGPGATGNREVKKKSGSDATWYRIRLPNANRGGFLTMSGPLMVTSLPFRTSPVKRGAWLLETIFNRPPTEPKVAFAIENDTREAAQAMSIREKFEAHRDKAACFSCHVRLDPPGFALERFSPIGQWRDTDGTVAVDAKGTWNGRPFDGPAEFKRLVRDDPGEFARGFVEHLLSYALCRKLEIHDMPAVTAIRQAAAEDDWRFGTIVAEIVKSYPFTHARAEDGSATVENAAKGDRAFVGAPLDPSPINP
ncbi:MAG: DUF1592 domain-containing protein [Verrucomicrobiae bacterium]|nr:DUF1592 domain-containing protein [Verrucomicrobiae bacterium]